jgi:hypothetical protein
MPRALLESARGGSGSDGAAIIYKAMRQGSSMLTLYTVHDFLKDGFCASPGLSLAAFLPHLEPVLWLGLANLLIVTLFRTIELWLRYRRKGKG